MKTGKHYFGLLTEDEQRNFRQACDEQGFEFRRKINIEYHSFSSFICRAFAWSETSENQGYYYWEAIANSNRDENSN